MLGRLRRHDRFAANVFSKKIYRGLCMTGIGLIVCFVIAVALMIFMIAKWRVHPFLALMAVSLALALVANLPLASIPGIIGDGFSAIFKSIGIVIIFGAISARSWRRQAPL